MQSFLRDVRFATRLMAARPMWTIAAILCLAIATGANTAAFSVVNALLLRPLPFEDAGRLVMVAVQEPDRTGPRPFSLDDYKAVSERAAGVELLARTFAPVSLAAADGAQMVEAELVSANYFDVLRLRPFAGAFPDPRAPWATAPMSIVISHALWQRRFGASPDVVGQAVRINGTPATVAAVAPHGFVGAMQLIAADVWLSADLLPAVGRSADAITVPMFGVMGRIPDNASRGELHARLNAAFASAWRDRRTGPSTLDAARTPTAIVRPASGFGVPPAVESTVLRGSTVIFGVMALLIAVAAGNVAALVLARSAGRQVEIAVRAALGAGRWRLVRQMLTESVVLALAGGAAGWLLAVWVTRVLAAQSETTFEYVSYAVDVQPDARVIVYTGLIVFATAALFGLAPAWQAARTDLVAALKQSGGGGRHTTSRVLRLLVAGQIAFSTALLAGCGLLVRSYVNALAVDPGIDIRGIVAMEFDFDQLGMREDEGRRTWEELRTRVGAIPGVSATSGTRQTPLSGSGGDVRLWIDPADDRTGAASLTAASEVVTPEHFDLLSVPLLEGRTFRTAEPTAPLVAIVNQTLAARIAPGGSAVGRRFHLGDVSSAPIEVIGVTADVKHRSITETPRAVVYQPFAQAYSARMTLLAALQVPAGQAAGAIRRAVRDVNPDLSIVMLRSLDDQRRIGLSFMRRAAIALGAICLLGLLLSVVGLYGVVSYGVRERAREFGIRLALGAGAANVRWMIMRQGFGIAAAGLAVGIALSLLLTRVLQSMVFGVGVRDPLTIAAVAVVLIAASSAALYVPARWATRLDPAATLRSE